LRRVAGSAWIAGLSTPVCKQDPAIRQPERLLTQAPATTLHTVPPLHWLTPGEQWSDSPSHVATPLQATPSSHSRAVAAQRPLPRHRCSSGCRRPGLPSRTAQARATAPRHGRSAHSPERRRRRANRGSGQAAENHSGPKTAAHRRRSPPGAARTPGRPSLVLPTHSSARARLLPAVPHSSRDGAIDQMTLVGPIT
jgi:hypothetical protein